MRSSPSIPLQLLRMLTSVESSEDDQRRCIVRIEELTQKNQCCASCVVGALLYWFGRECLGESLRHTPEDSDHRAVEMRCEESAPEQVLPTKDAANDVRQCPFSSALNVQRQTPADAQMIRHMPHTVMFAPHGQ